MEPLIPPTKKEEPEQERKKEEDAAPHPTHTGRQYYGDTVRRLFIFSALLMLVTLPFFAASLSVPLVVSLFAILAVAVIAGLTNPRQLWVAALNTGCSIIALISFEYYAIVFYSTGGSFQFIFWITQLLAVAFLFALYFSVKTLRGMIK